MKRDLRFGKDGTFRILQISDLHSGELYVNPPIHAIHVLLEASRPDLVVFDGDVVIDSLFEGKDYTAARMKKHLDKVLAELVEKDIPFANVFGNHDGEGPKARSVEAIEKRKRMQQKIYDSYPNCVSGRSPSGVHGLSNYLLQVKDSRGAEPLFNLFFLDSLCSAERDFSEAFGIAPEGLTYPSNLIDNQNGDSTVLPDQVAWYYNTSKKAEKQAGRKLPAIMWMHNPLMEMRLIRQNPEACRMEGNLREEIGCSVMNSGLFMACLERGDVKGIYFGHDHRNDCSGTVHGIHMGYDGALYDQRRERDLVDNRGGREFVLYEDGRPYTTRMIRLADFNLPVEEKVKKD